jgi:RNA polymerase sigma factor (sigma-70 family)
MHLALRIEKSAKNLKDSFSGVVESFEGQRMEPSTRHSLVLRLRNAADEAAWAEFVSLYEPFVYRLARRKGLQDADAQDLCQEVFRAVASAIDRWDPDPAKGSFRGWLFRIARNLSVNFLTSQRRQARGTGRTTVQELLEAQQEPDAQAEAEFTIEFKRQAFRWAAERVRHEFADSTWQAFWKTGVENLSVSAVAEELGLSVGAVYIARSRVLARLRARATQITSDSGLNWEDNNGQATPSV